MSSEGKIVVLSDLHANLSALEAVTEHIFTHYSPQAMILLGDVVNYGMRPNETIVSLEQLEQKLPMLCAIRGNHDDAMLDCDRHVAHFSTDRGRQALRTMSQMLDDRSVAFIEHRLAREGYQETTIGLKRILCVHGDISNPLWGKMNDTHDKRYSGYDYVFSGHSHVPYLSEVFFEADSPSFRNKHKTVFINPGSVGQPRNHNPLAQYAYVDVGSGTVHFNAVPYDVAKEMSLYGGEIDPFYQTRLKNGI